MSLFSQKNKDILIKKRLDSLSKKQIGNLVNGNIVHFLNGYSKNYTDLGGGPDGNGIIDFIAWQKKLENFVLSEDHKKIKDKSINELLIVSSKKILNYSEIVKEKGNIKRFNFILRKGDYYVSYPPKKGSPMFDGWFAFYRLENNKWKIIAGD